MTQIEYCPFVVNDTPYCIWDFDIHQQNKVFCLSRVLITAILSI